MGIRNQHQDLEQLLAKAPAKPEARLLRFVDANKLWREIPDMEGYFPWNTIVSCWVLGWTWMDYVKFRSNVCFRECTVNVVQGFVKIQRDLGVVSSTLTFVIYVKLPSWREGQGGSLVLSWVGNSPRKQERRIPTSNTTSVAKLQANTTSLVFLFSFFTTLQYMTWESKEVQCIPPM